MLNINSCSIFPTSDPSFDYQAMLEDLKDPSVTCIDVRMPQEYAHGHARGAVLLPLFDLNEMTAEKLKQYKKVYVICASGNRSEHATHFLTQCGVGAINVPGGTMEWARLGLPME